MISIHRFPFLYFKFNSCKMKFLQEPLRVMPKTIRNFSMRRHIGGSVTFKGPKLAHQTEADVRHVLPEHTSTFRRPSKFWYRSSFWEMRRKNISPPVYDAACHSRILYMQRVFYLGEDNLCDNVFKFRIRSPFYIFFARSFFRNGVIRTRSFLAKKGPVARALCGNWISPEIKSED